MGRVQERRSTLPIVKHLSSVLIVPQACIAHISHHWCTFFKLVPLLASKTLNFGQFWPFLAILSRIYALVGAPITGLNSAVVPQN